MAIPIARVATKERDGEHLRTIWYVDSTPLLKQRLWERMRGLSTPFQWGTLEEPSKLDILDNDSFVTFVVDTVGVVVAGLVTDDVWDVHVCFWDRVLRGREPIARVIAEHLFSLNAKQLLTMMPSSATAIRAFARRIGFHEAAIRVGAAFDIRGNPDDLVVLILNNPSAR